jgi:xanthine dehydrogenase accessory factor
MSGTDIWEEIVACRRRGEPAALATIVSTLGSTPGKDPMKMLVRSDGTFVGSVGGGCLEAEVWDHARTVMLSQRAMTVEFSLTEKDYPDSGLICGGRLTVFIEPVTAPNLHVFGAGHVGLATARLAADAGFRVLVHDDRADMLDADRLGPGIVGVPGEYEAAEDASRPGIASYVVVMTRGHHDDERVLRALWGAGCRPRFLGMIGSRAKRKVLWERLEADGLARDWLDAVVSPVGLPIGARTAAEIAVSVVAQLIGCVRAPAGGEPEQAASEPAQRPNPPAPEAALRGSSAAPPSPSQPEDRAS